MYKIKKCKETSEEKYKCLPRISIGDSVSIMNSKLHGIIRFIGVINFETNEILYGIELSEPKDLNNGFMNNSQYFQCKDKYGIFINYSQILPMLYSSSNPELHSEKQNKKNTENIT